jgi:hypothetical protein
MKFIVAVLFSFLFFTTTKADDDKYTNAMEKNISLIDSAKSLADFQNVTNNFERIASAEKSKWLPYYYASYCCAISSFFDTTNSKKDTYLDKADEYVNLADSLKQDNSELYTLKGLISQMRLMVNPMTRWQKYGPLANNYFKKAKELDPTNPRPDYLIGQSLLYTPVQFGGGKEVARPILEESLKKFESFKLENSISPDWGKKMVKNILDQISKTDKK